MYDIGKKFCSVNSAQLMESLGEKICSVNRQLYGLCEQEQESSIADFWTLTLEMIIYVPAKNLRLEHKERELTCLQYRRNLNNIFIDATELYAERIHKKFHTNNQQKQRGVV
jgi:hypothetical protein